MIDFPFKLAVGEAVQANIYGSMVKYVIGSAGGADPSIRVKTDGGDEYVLLPGQGFKFDNKAFTKLNISNAGGVTPVIGRLLLADSDFIDNRTSGSVEVIDGGKNRTMAGITFMGLVGSPPAAAKYSHTQLFNPANSGKNLIIEAVTFSTTGTNLSCYLRSSNAALTTLSGPGSCKKLGAPASVGTMYSDANAVLLGTATLHAFDSSPNVPFTYRCNEPIICPPGFGLIAANGWVNNQLDVNYEWYEENI